MAPQACFAEQPEKPAEQAAKPAEQAAKPAEQAAKPAEQAAKNSDPKISGLVQNAAGQTQKSVPTQKTPDQASGQSQLPQSSAANPKFSGRVSLSPSPPGQNKEPALSGLALQGMGENTIADMVDRVSPAVVNIVCTGTASRVQISRMETSGDNSRKLRRHLGLGSEYGNLVRTSGAGIIVRSDGFILTCLHVIQNADDVKVVLKDGRRFDAKVIGRDSFLDLAMVKIAAAGLPTVKFGDPEKLRVGQWVFAIGNPFAYESSVSAGLVSGLHREAKAYSQAFGARTGAVRFIQTDVPLNEGSSGGPLFTLHGEVIGINSFIRVGAQNIGFATPADQVKKVAEQFISSGNAHHPYLGIEMGDTDLRIQGAGAISGVEVSKVKVPSPANNAGMQVGDIILQMDSQAVHDPTDVSRVVAAHDVGEHIEVLVMRGGKEKKLDVKIESLPDDFDR